MDAASYLIEVERTLFGADRRTDRFSCSALGLAGESSEVLEAIENARPVPDCVKEFGDLLWYVFALFISAGIEPGPAVDRYFTPGLLTHTPKRFFRPEVGRDLVDTITKALSRDTSGWAIEKAGECLKLAAKSAELVKKHLYHGKDLDVVNLGLNLRLIVGNIGALAEYMDSSLPEVAAANVTKLRARFPEGFTPEAACAKADERPAPAGLPCACDCEPGIPQFLNGRCQSCGGCE